MLLQVTLFHSFNGWVVFHCINAPHLYPFLFWCTFRLLSSLGYFKKCCNEYWSVHILSDHFSPLNICPEVGKHHIISYIFIFLGNFHRFLHSGHTNLRSHQQCMKVLFPTHLLQHFFVCDFFDESHFDCCEVISHSFDLHFFNNQWW